MFAKCKEKKLAKAEAKAASDKMAIRKARIIIAVSAVTSTVVAVITAVIVAERIIQDMSTRDDWSDSDWGIDDTDLI